MSNTAVVVSSQDKVLSLLFCVQSTTIGALAGLAIVMWIAVGSYVTPPYVEYLPTDVTNCTLPTNSSLPEDPYVFNLFAPCPVVTNVIGMVMVV